MGGDRRKEGMKKKSQKMYWNSAPYIIFPVQNISNICQNKYSYRRTEIVKLLWGDGDTPGYTPDDLSSAYRVRWICRIQVGPTIFL